MKSQLYNLRVTTMGDQNTFRCDHTEGESFEVRGGNIFFSNCDSFSMYALGSLLSLLPAKQRKTEDSDWMTHDAYIACPDPDCGARFHISREGVSTTT